MGFSATIRSQRPAPPPRSARSRSVRRPGRRRGRPVAARPGGRGAPARGRRRSGAALSAIVASPESAPAYPGSAASAFGRRARRTGQNRPSPVSREPLVIGVAERRQGRGIAGFGADALAESDDQVRRIAGCRRRLPGLRQAASRITPWAVDRPGWRAAAANTSSGRRDHVEFRDRNRSFVMVPPRAAGGERRPGRSPTCSSSSSASGGTGRMGRLRRPGPGSNRTPSRAWPRTGTPSRYALSV